MAVVSPRLKCTGTAATTPPVVSETAARAVLGVWAEGKSICRGVHESESIWLGAGNVGPSAAKLVVHGVGEGGHDWAYGSRQALPSDAPSDTDVL